MKKADKEPAFSYMQENNKSLDEFAVRKQNRDVLGNVSCRIGDGSCVAKHVSAANNANLFHPKNDSQRIAVVTRLQQQYGNRFVQKVITKYGIRPKLAVGQPGDKYEREAEEVAEAVTQMPKLDDVTSAIKTVQLLQRSVMNHTKPVTVPPIVHEVLHSPGQPLDPATRPFMESYFGWDFSEVRVHSGIRAAESARAINARAYTVGRDIVFGAGQYAPKTSEEKQLLAHELTHVIQQTAGRRSFDRPLRRPAIDRQGDIHEAESERVAEQANVGTTFPVGLQVRQRAPVPLACRANIPQVAAALSRGAIAGIQFHPMTVAGTRVGPVSGLGGLMLSAIIGRGTTIRDMASILLPLWNTATPFTPPGATAPRPLVPLTVDELARGLLVYNQYYLPVLTMARWRVGLRFPLPVEIDQTNNEGILHPDIIRLLAGTFNPAWEPLLDRFPLTPASPAAAVLRQAATDFLTAQTTTLARGVHLSARAITNPLEERDFILEVFNQLGANAFYVALAFMDNLVNRQVDLLASQSAGADILNRISAILAAAPAILSKQQQDSLNRANGMVGRVATAAPRAEPYVLPDATRPLNLNRQTNVALFAMNLWAEAWTEVRRYGRRSLEAVAQVVLNRVACGFAGTPRDVILAPLQFSWTRPASPVYARAFEPVRNSNEAVWLQCLDVATDALSGTMANPGVDNADHYYNPAAAAPTWASPSSFVIAIGNHRFHRLRCPSP